MMTCFDVPLDKTLVVRRLGTLINQFFKILQMKENGEESLPIYIASLEREMLGYRDLIVALGKDDQYLALLAELEYMRSHNCSVGVVRCEVFKSINILKQMQKRYAEGAVG